MKTLITSASVGLLILILSFSTGHAKIKLMGVGGHIGLVDPEGDIGSTIALGGNADLGEIIPNLKLTTDVECWSAGIEYAGTTAKDFKYKDLALRGTAKYFFSVADLKFAPYAGGGLGLHHFSWTYPTWTLGGSKEESDSENKLEFHFVGGAEYPINPQLTGYAELRYDSGDCDIMGIYVGVNYALSSQK